MLKKVRLKDLKPNRFRDIRVDPLDDDATETLRDSIRQFGFKSGGVSVRQFKDGTLEIQAGHTRVAAAIKEKIEFAEVEVEVTDDDTQMRWLAQENATQRGQSSTAGIGSVVGAIMVLAPRIMKGELNKLPPRWVVSRGTTGNNEKPKEKETRRTISDLEKLQGRLATETGIGEDIICDFLHGIPGFTSNAVRDYLKQVKATGAYARTITEIADRVEKEHQAEGREAERLEREAEREARAAATREAEAEERERKADEKTERAKAAAARKAATKARKTADKKKASASKTRRNTGAGRAERTRAAVAKHEPTLNEQVAKVFQNKEQVRVFFEAISNIGSVVVPLDKQVDLAKAIIQKAADWPGRPREVSSTFIREQISQIVFYAKNANRRAHEAEWKEARERDYRTRALEMLHQSDRDLERFIIQNGKLAELMDQHPDVQLEIRERVLGNFRKARDRIEEFLKRVEQMRDPDNVTRLRLV